MAKFRGKETVFAKCDPAKNIMNIQEGGVRLSTVSTTDNEAVIVDLDHVIWGGEPAPARCLQTVVRRYCQEHL